LDCDLLGLAVCWPNRVEVRVLKAAGYLISTMSVLLLGAVAWAGTADHPEIRILLILGIATSIAGMFLRWLSYLHEQREKQDRVLVPATTAAARSTASGGLAAERTK
jgi:hypothetical protein